MNHRTPAFRLRRLGALAALCAGVLLTAGTARAQTPETVRAIFLFNFAKNVEWPEAVFADAKSPIVIGIHDAPDIASALERTVRGKDANGRDVAVKRIQNPDQAESCHVVFLANERRGPEFVEALRGKPVLTVGERDDFTEIGGMIKLLERDEKVRCFVNVTVSSASGLKLSSRLVASKD